MTDRRSRFSRNLKAARRRTRLYGPFQVGDFHSNREVLVSKSLALAVAIVLVTGLTYALFKFFQMVRLRHLEVGSLWFVPAAIAVAVTILLVKVVRPLVKEIRSRHSSK